MTERLPRSRPEWVTFAVSLGVIVALIIVLLVESRGNLPASPEVRLLGVTRLVDGSLRATAEVENKGDLAATNVEVAATLATPNTAGPEGGTQIVTFLAGHESVEIQFNFSPHADTSDIKPADIAIRIASFVTT